MSSAASKQEQSTFTRLSSESLNIAGNRPSPVSPVSTSAKLNFLGASETAPRVSYASGQGEATQTGTHVARWVDVQNARVSAKDASLDREGFELRNQESAVADFEDDREVERVYYPEIIELVKQATGASRVEIFDHTVRKNDNAQGRSPASHLHVDYTEKSAPTRIKDIVGDDADALLGKRHIQVNVWRSIAGVVKRSPLAFLDSQTLKQNNLVPTPIEYQATGRVGEVYRVTHDEDQQWYYYPQMTEDEVVLIKGYDSLKDGRARFTPHGAFDDPTSPANAPRRESIEVRTFAFFDD